MHRLAAAFAAHFAGGQVDASSPQGRFAEGAALLDGRMLEAAEAHGKQMFLGFSGALWLRVHLGLYGMWRFFGPGLAGLGRGRGESAGDPDMPPPPRGAVRLRLASGGRIADLSGPTACQLLSPVERAAFTAGLGDDPLRDDADPARAYGKLHASRTALGLLLMRQDMIAGIGNIYRAETLFRARLEPHRPGRTLTPQAWEALWTDLGELMRDGVRTGRIVTTESGHRSRRTRTVSREDATYVAHRAGAPCRICGEPVLAEPMGGRMLYWCPRCQTG